MNAAQARLRVSLAEGAFEVEGSESFVVKQSEIYKDLITKSLTSTEPVAKKKNAPDPEKLPTANDLANVFHKDGAAVKVLVTLPGNSQKEKTINAALLALKAMGDDSEISFDVVRKICHDHSCLNRGNFSSYLKDEKKLFLIGGSGKSATLRLTQPGKTAASQLVTTLAVQNK